MKDQHPAGRRGVDSVGEGHKADTAPFQMLGCFDELLEGPCQSVELPDDEGIPIPQDVAEQTRQLRPVGAGTGSLLDDCALAAGRPQTFKLEVRALVEGGYTGIADTHDTVSFLIRMIGK